MRRNAAWMAPRLGGYQPKPNGKPKGLPPKGPGCVARPGHTQGGETQ